MTYVNQLDIEISQEDRRRREAINKADHDLWRDCFVETRETITHKCTKCGTTHPDLKSARMCVEQCISSFKSPDELYKEQLNAKTAK